MRYGLNHEENDKLNMMNINEKHNELIVDYDRSNHNGMYLIDYRDKGLN